jgi:hypothetical protein
MSSFRRQTAMFFERPSTFLVVAIVSKWRMSTEKSQARKVYLTVTLTTEYLESTNRLQPSPTIMEMNAMVSGDPVVQED